LIQVRTRLDADTDISTKEKDKEKTQISSSVCSAALFSLSDVFPRYKLNNEQTDLARESWYALIMNVGIFGPPPKILQPTPLFPLNVI